MVKKEEPQRSKTNHQGLNADGSPEGFDFSDC
jgi:hypothetical protein